MDETGNPHNGGSIQARQPGEQHLATVAPTPVRRALAVKITNREQIERLTPAQKQKLMRIVIAKRQLATQRGDRDDQEDKENAGGDEILSSLKPTRYTLEKRDSNHFPAPANLSPSSKRQKLSHDKAGPAAVREHPTLAYAPFGRTPPSVEALQTLQWRVEKIVHEKRALLRLKTPEVHMRVVFKDGTELSKSLCKMTQLFDELPRCLVDRILSKKGERIRDNAVDASNTAGATGSSRAASAELIKLTRQTLSQVYATHSRKLLADFKASHQISVFEINGIDPSTLPLGIDVFWNWGCRAVKYNRIGVVDMRAFRAGKSLDACLFFSTSGGQAWDVMYALRPNETLHLNWRMTGNTFNPHGADVNLVRSNELVYVPLDLDAEEIAGFGYDTIKSLWSSSVSDDEKRGVLRCLVHQLRTRAHDA